MPGIHLGTIQSWGTLNTEQKDTERKGYSMAIPNLHPLSHPDQIFKKSSHATVPLNAYTVFPPVLTNQAAKARRLFENGQCAVHSR
jgi:hypothetical protein